jgi:hypothetical protein
MKLNLRSRRATSCEVSLHPHQAAPALTHSLTHSSAKTCLV